ncbi:MAG: LacI family DNA-binding transcriptional regulator [Actinoplanes sp.]
MEHDQRRTPQIRDVAAAAGVSHQTVSRVLNNSPNVRPDTRRLVTEAVERLRCRPNRAQRKIISGVTSGAVK